MAREAAQKRKYLTIAVVTFWLALFAATHVPRVPAALHMPGADKWQHTLAYAALACLLAALKSFRRPFTARLALSVAAVVIAYGIVDELTQIPVGRDAEFNDWLADCLGASLGVSLYAGVRRAFPSLFLTTP